jgi:hypothetical protein
VTWMMAGCLLGVGVILGVTITALCVAGRKNSDIIVMRDQATRRDKPSLDTQPAWTRDFYRQHHDGR